ncbi:MAG: hypothetical protein JO249_03160 [Acidobacteria bacterium]|nr:hypothetical protein [Acidobacteriota bacterium]
MQTTVGIFASRAQAEQALKNLLSSGTPASSINYFTGECPPKELETLRTTDAEAPGMGQAMGTFLGGVIGASGGLSIGSAVASLLVPGIGPILAFGLGAAALLGVGGAAAGRKAGHKSEDALDEGIPKDEVFFYRDLLRQGRSLVIVQSDSDDHGEAINTTLNRAGAEDARTARRLWEEAHPRGLERAS